MALAMMPIEPEAAERGAMKPVRSDDNFSTPGTTDILVIEDDALQAHEIETHLQRQGFTVNKLASGPDSLHNVARIDPRS